MTRTLFFSRLEAILLAMCWTGTATKIFSQVKSVPVLPIQTLGQIVSPFCFIVEAGFKNHSEHPNIIMQNFNIEFFVENIQSEYGKGALMSANRVANTSKGAGIIDIETEIQTQIRKTISLTDGIQIVEESGQKASMISGNFPLAWRIMTFSVMLET